MPSSPTILSRRDFLRLAALSPLALGVSSQAYEPVARVAGPFFKPTVNAYSFLELLNANLKDSTQGMDLFRVCAFCAKHNVEAVDLTGYFFPGYPAPPQDAYVNRIRRFVHDNGMVVSGTGVKNDFATADKSERMAGVQLTKDWIEVASRLGAPVVRVFAGPHGKTNWQAASGNAKREEVEAWMAEDLRACAEYGEKFGVIVAVQNHGDFISTGAEHLSLLNRTDHAWCGPLVDTGKYLTENPYEDIALMAPYAVNWQIKETMGSSLKSPRTDFLRLVKIIKNAGYRGYVPIETLAMGRKDYDPLAEVVHVLNAMREAQAALG